MSRESGQQQAFQNICRQNLDGLTAGKIRMRNPRREMLQPSERFVRFRIGEEATPGGEQSPDRREDCFQPNLARRHSHALSRFTGQVVAMNEEVFRRFGQQPCDRANPLIAPRL